MPDLNVTEFPVEVWYLICNRLNVVDILSLIRCNQKLSWLLRSDPIWRNIVKKRWYQDIFWPGIERMMPKELYYKVYLFRSMKDSKLRSQIQRMIKLGYNYDWIIQIFNEGPWMYIPELLRLRNHSFIWHSGRKRVNILRERLDNLKTVYIASSVLQSIQFYLCFNSLTKVFALNELPSSRESFLMEFGSFDPEYFELLTNRSNVITRIVNSSKREIDTIPGCSRLRKVLIVISYLRKLISPNYITTNPSIEDMMVLRNYLSGSHWQTPVLNAIVQKICLALNIHIRINPMCIEVVNKDQVRYFIILRDSNTFVATAKELPDSFKEFDTIHDYCRFVVDSIYGSDQNTEVYHTGSSMIPITSCLQHIMRLYLGFLLHGVSSLKKLVNYLAKKHMSASLIMLRFQLRIFVNENWYNHLDSQLVRTIDGIKKFDRLETDFRFKPEQYREYKFGKHGQLIRDMSGEYGVVIANNKRENVCLCYMSDHEYVIYRPEELRICTDINAEAVLQLAENDALGEFFTHFNWKLGQFE